ncbi:MAG: META domain-containing protein [Marmoricola sp.]
MNETELHEAFERLTQSPAPSRYQLGSVQSTVKRKRQRFQLVSVVGATALAIALGVLILGHNSERKPEPNVLRPTPTVTLDGQWRVVALKDEDGKSLLRSDKVRVIFKAGKVGGSTECNGFGGPYKQSGPGGEDLFISNRIGSTLVGCNETPIGLRLSAVRHANELDGVLYLQSENRTNIAILVRAFQPVSLQGTWRVTAVKDAEGKSVPITKFTKKAGIEFKEGGVSGNDGCNDFAGRFTQAGPDRHDLALHITDMTAALCRTVATLRLLEVRHIAEENGSLYLKDENWATIATLERVGMSPQQTGAVLGQVQFSAIARLAPPKEATVQFTNGATVQTVAANSKGRFSIRLAPGTYTVTATTSQYVVNGKKGLCRAAEPVNVTAESVTPDVQVYCVTK